MNWKNTDSELPDDNSYVLGIYNGKNWFDKHDQVKAYYKVVKFERGISIYEREMLPNGDDRKKEYNSCDEYGNNKKPYCWSEFGPGQLFGQDITYWMPLPEYPVPIVNR